MEEVIRGVLKKHAKDGEVSEVHRSSHPSDFHDGRPEPAPGGSTIIEFRAAGLPLVKLVGRKKGATSFSVAGNLENSLWNALEPDVLFWAAFDVDMAPERDFLQLMLPPFFEYRDSGNASLSGGGCWKPNWSVAWTSCPQYFSNTQDVYGTEDPLNQANKLYWNINPPASDSYGLVHFWGTNAVFFVPAIKDASGFVYGCITEDNATSYQIHDMGWSSAFVSKSLAKGMVRESVTESLDQRKRWAMGNAQQLIAGWDLPMMHEDFRNAPYRKVHREKMSALRKLDRSEVFAQPIDPDDVAADKRRSRRTSLMSWLRLELHYTTTKMSVIFFLQPVWQFALLFILTAHVTFPIWVDSSPAYGGSLTFFKSYHVVLLYMFTVLLSQVVYCSDSFGDHENSHFFSVILMRDPFTYGWVRILGVIQGVIAAYNGKEPKWNVSGTITKTNWAYALPNLIAFATLPFLMSTTLLQIYLNSSGGEGLEVLVCRILYAAYLIHMMLPVVTCIGAEILQVPYYYMRNVLAEITMVTVMVVLFTAWVMPKVNQMSTTM